MWPGPRASGSCCVLLYATKPEGFFGDAVCLCVRNMIHISIQVLYDDHY